MARIGLRLHLGGFLKGNPRDEADGPHLQIYGNFIEIQNFCCFCKENDEKFTGRTDMTRIFTGRGRERNSRAEDGPHGNTRFSED